MSPARSRLAAGQRSRRHADRDRRAARVVDFLPETTRRRGVEAFLLGRRRPGDRQEPAGRSGHGRRRDGVSRERRAGPFRRAGSAARAQNRFGDRRRHRHRAQGASAFPLHRPGDRLSGRPQPQGLGESRGGDAAISRRFRLCGRFRRRSARLGQGFRRHIRRTLGEHAKKQSRRGPNSRPSFRAGRSIFRRCGAGCACINGRRTPWCSRP